MTTRTEPGPSDRLITVAVPCHGGADRLPGLLDALVRQEYPADGFEVLVVDNASPEPLAPTVARYAERLNVRVLREDRLGLSHARNRALEEAGTPIIVFLDDDVRPSPGLIAAYASAFADGGLHAAGGPIRPQLDGRAPWWFRGAVRSLYSVQDLGSATDYGAGYPFGANFAVRRSEVVRPFAPELGRRGSDLLSGEEGHFFRTNRLQPVRHVPEAIVSHVIPPGRLTVGWLVRRGLAQLRTRRVLSSMEATGPAEARHPHRDPARERD